MNPFDSEKELVRSRFTSAPAIRLTLGVLLVAAGYYFGALIGLALKFPFSPLAAIWPPNAVILAALLLSPKRRWWLYSLAVLLAHAAFTIPMGLPLWRIMWQAGSNFFMALLAAIGLRHISEGPYQFDRLPQVIAFLLAVVTAAGVGSITSIFFVLSFVSATFQLQTPITSNYWLMWERMFLSNLLGFMTLTPTILLWANNGIAWLRGASLRRYVEACLLTISLLTVCFVAFSMDNGGPGNSLALLYAPLPFLLWATVRFGPGGVCSSLLIVFLILIWNAVNGRGPFGDQSPTENTLSLELFLISLSVPLVLLAAVIQEHLWDSEELRRAQRLYQELVQSIEAIVWRADAKTFQFNFVSKEAEKCLGYPVGRWIDEPNFWRDHIHPEDREWVPSLCLQATAENKDHEFEYRMIAADGRVIWLRDNVRVIIEEGKPKELIGVMTDITQSKLAEEQLKESENQLRLLTELIPQQVWSSRSDGSIDYVNQRWIDFTGLKMEEALGDGGLSILHPDEREQLLKYHSENLATGTPFERELRLRSSDGEYRWFLARGLPLLNEKGEIIRWYGTNTDIEDRKQIEEALRFSEDKFSKAFRSSPDAFAISRQSDGLLLEVNESWESLLGYNRNEALGRSVSELQLYANPDDRELLIALVRDQGSVCELEKKIRRKSGEIRLASISAEPIMLNNEPCLMVILRDITERKQMEEALRESHARIEEMAGRLIVAQEEERKHIARELHDDLNQQVAALAIGLGKLERLLPNADETIRKQIAKLESRMLHLSEQIRLLSHELHSSILEQVGLAEALKLHCSEFTDREGISVTIDIHEIVEAIPTDAALCLYRVTQESLRNIAKHSGAKTAEVKLASTIGSVELCVADHGVGFDLEQASLRRGLGLISIEERVRLLHGRFEVKSQPGLGTELRVHLPLRCIG